jgi:hypothetical protein
VLYGKEGPMPQMNKLTSEAPDPYDRIARGPNIFDSYAEDLPALAKNPGRAEGPFGPPSSADPGPKKASKPTGTGKGASTKPTGKKKRKTKAPSKAERPSSDHDEDESATAKGLKAALQGMAYIPATGGTASSILRAMVGGAYAGQSIQDAITSARKTHERLNQERAGTNSRRSLADESVGD